MISLVSARQCLKIVWNPIFRESRCIHLQNKIQRHRQRWCFIIGSAPSAQWMQLNSFQRSTSSKHFTSLVFPCVLYFRAGAGNAVVVVVVVGDVEEIRWNETKWKPWKSQSSVWRTCMGLHKECRGAKEKIENSTKICLNETINGASLALMMS